jgi:tRNA dimethylallyltransferase
MINAVHNQPQNEKRHGQTGSLHFPLLLSFLYHKMNPMSTLERQWVSPKILVILGPTASGKSTLAISLAKKLNGEIISADSRQVYRGLDIGTAKVPRDQPPGSKSKISKRTRNPKNKNAPYVHKGIPHHLIDFVSPRRRYTAAEYQKAGRAAIANILARGRLPIICGGTGLYVDALLSPHDFPAVAPDAALRARLEKKSAGELFARLRTLDPRRAKTIDRRNKRRLIRALEIVMATGRPAPRRTANPRSHIFKNARMSQVKIVKIGLAPRPARLRQRINARLARDLRRGLIEEVRTLHARGLSWKRLDELGLEYRYVAQYLRGDMRSKEELERKLQTELRRYAKRQMTWFKRDEATFWFPNGTKALRFAHKLLR